MTVSPLPQSVKRTSFANPKPEPTGRLPRVCLVRITDRKHADGGRKCEVRAPDFLSCPAQLGDCGLQFGRWWTGDATA